MIPVSFDITLFVVAMLGAVVAVGMSLLRHLLVFTERKRIAAVELRCAQLRKRQEQMTEHYRQVQERVRGMDVDIKSMHTQIADVQRRIKQARADNHMIVHEVGEPGGKRRLFTGTLSLGSIISVSRTSSQDSLLRGVRHLVEVWTESEAEAMDMAKRAFPAEGGFILSKMRRPDQAGPAAVLGEMPDAAPSMDAKAAAPVRTKPMLRKAAAE